MAAPLRVTGGPGLNDLVNPVFQTVGLATFNGFLYESGTDNIVAAAGGGQASAVLLTAEMNRIITVATSGDSVKLPPSVAGLTIFVANHGANPMGTFGSGFDTIDDQAFAVGVTQMQSSVVLYCCITAGQWYTEGLATGYAGNNLQTLSVADNLTGNAAQNGLALGAMVNAFSTVASAGNGGTLPVSKAGMEITTINKTATSANVWPATGEQINALGANTPLALATQNLPVVFYCLTAGQWFSK